MKHTPLFAALVLIALEMGCSATVSQNAAKLPPADKLLVASGYGRFDDSGQIAVNQRWWSAQQAAKLDAYRDLAEQLYQQPLDDKRTVGSQVVKDEQFRLYVDSYLRQARATDYRTVKDVLKTRLELSLTSRFYQCLNSSEQVAACLQQDNKMAFTRLGTKTATTNSANLACAQRDCSDQLYVSGFSNDRNQLDKVLLDAGLYDSEWFVNTGGDVMGRYFLLQGIFNGL